MNREIKYKAYSKVHGTIFDVRNIFFYHDEGKSGLNAVELLDENENTQLVPASEVELLQYTCIKDKNGVEIFEGDVVSLRSISDDQSYGMEISVGVVTTHNGCWVIDDNYDPSRLFIDQNEYSIAIIGNIYENPELLGV